MRYDSISSIQTIWGNNWTWKKKGIEFFFIFVLLISFPILLGGGYETYYYDANYYFYTADPVLADGFNLFALPETFRGYLLPLIILFVKTAMAPIFGENSWVSYSIFSSVLTAAMITIILPYLFELKASLRVFVGELITTLLVLFFWGDFLQYPLADLPAMVFMAVSLALLKYLCTNELIVWKRLLFGCLTGMSFYAAYSAKVTYQYGIIIALIWVLIFYRKKSLLLCLIPSIFVGMFLLGIPQMLLNGQYTGQYTPAVLTNTYTYTGSLELYQVFAGINELRLESYVGNHSYWSGDNILFHDIVGSTIWNTREQIKFEDFSYLDLLGLFLKYPMDMIGIYTRHLVSLMTPLYREVYVHDLYLPKGFNIVTSFLVWFLTGLGLWISFHGTVKNQLTAKNSLFLCILFPAALTVVGVSEIRFFISVYFLSYFGVCCCVNWKEMWKKLSPYFLRIVAVFLLIFCLWTGVVSSLMTNAGGEVFLINDSSKEFIATEELYFADEVTVANTEGNVGVQDFSSVMQVKFQNGESYRLSFDLDCDVPPSVLYFDLNGTNFDPGVYDFLFDWNIGEEHYSCVFTCTDMPEDVLMRLVHVTSQEYSLKNVKLEKGVIGRS